MTEELPPNPTRQVLEPPRDAATLNPEARRLYRDNPIDLRILRELAGQSIINVADMSRAQVCEICKLAAVLENTEIAPFHPLDGKIAVTAFFEASTRTRTSFESAMMRLDGKIISIADGGLTGVAKGESLYDIGEMVNAYCDLVIMRHTKTEAVDELQESLRIPLVNAGNGSGEHPTQALADWYALLKWNPALEQLSEGKKSKELELGILGTPGSMRAVKSFLLMSLFFSDHIKKVSVISEMADPFGADVIGHLKEAEIDYEVTNDIQEVLPRLDVIYMNSIAFLGDSYKTLDARFKLDSESHLKPEAVILHPLARRDELDRSLDKTSHNLYFSQAHGAVFVRQALLMSIFNRLDRLPGQIPTID